LLGRSLSRSPKKEQTHAEIASQKEILRLCGKSIDF
jgi:hypothetical protein